MQTHGLSCQDLQPCLCVCPFPGPFKKTFWSVLVVVTLSMLLFHTYTVIRAFLSYSVTVDMKIQTERELLFPAVTFCNVNPIKVSALVQKRDESPLLASVLLDSEGSEGDPEILEQNTEVVRRRKRAVPIGKSPMQTLFHLENMAIIYFKSIQKV